MKIKTITCHDVYNVGASLQAYALQTYLANEGHDVEIINYKPEYLRHYRLWWVPNPRFNKPVIRTIYNLIKLPKRLQARYTDPRKKAFDSFTSLYLKTTDTEYHSAEELNCNIPEADVYICGSDQIWNPVFKNGDDPSFFLDFVPEHKKKVSYAASFAVDNIPEHNFNQMKCWLSSFDSISVREESGVKILRQMGLNGIQVCDPVFLMNSISWNKLIDTKASSERYVLVYDFDCNTNISKACIEFARRKNLKIISVYSMPEANMVLPSSGPIEFLQTIKNASFVISNSFHATAFSLIFHKEFAVFNRKENINTRMRDLLISMGVSDRLLTDDGFIPDFDTIDWKTIDRIIIEQQQKAKEFLRLSI